MAREILQAGGLWLTFDPDLGGAILSLSHDGRDLLRPTPDGVMDVLQTACFPLVPYANRIADGRFTFAGRTSALSRNMAGQPHPLHGEGWRRRWRVEAKDPAAATLVLEPDTTEWPWAYRARQTFRLTATSMSAELEVTNLDEAPGPFGLGFHPYFPESPTARLTADTSGIWQVSADLIPTQHVQASPWASGANVQTERLIDHCYTGWKGRARIDLGPGRPSMRLSASPEARWLHVYAPPDQGIFCVEPVTHSPNALNMSDPTSEGICILAPNESLTLEMRLELM